MPYFYSPETIRKINDQAIEILIDYYSEPEKQKVMAFAPKKDVYIQFHEEDPPGDGTDLEEVVAYFRGNILSGSVKTWHPYFMNQMSAGAPYPAVLGDLFSSMMNPTLSTWEAAPVATIIENNVTRWMAKILGMKKGSSGIILPGGSLANMLALAVARNTRLDLEIRELGLSGLRRGAILCSQGCHYSIANAANLLGIGLNQLIGVATNERNEMLVEDLKAKIATCQQQGIEPFAVVVTLGLTVTGGFDPLEEIVAICKPLGIHIHVDAAFGGVVAMTPQGRDLFRGIEQADTVIWDAHKGLYAPLPCTALLAPDASIFKTTFNTNACYLFHSNEREEEVEDLGQYTILCGKRFEALKVWFLFKTYGTNFFREVAMDRMRVVRQAYEYLKADPDLVPSHEPVSPVQCFRYLPPSIREADPEFIDGLQRQIRETIKNENFALFNITKHRGNDHFRMILINPLTTFEHLQKLFVEIGSLGKKLLEANSPSVYSAT